MTNTYYSYASQTQLHKEINQAMNDFGGWLFPCFILNILLSFYVVLSIIWAIIFQFRFLSSV